MGPLLVEMGYATSFILDETTSRTAIAWTPLGKTLKIELTRLSRAIAEGKGTEGQRDFLIVLSFFVDTPKPPVNEG